MTKQQFPLFMFACCDVHFYLFQLQLTHPDAPFHIFIFEFIAIDFMIAVQTHQIAKY
jgi:hypothetical protein